MNKRDAIIEDLISDYGVDYETVISFMFPYSATFILCNGDGCRSDECSCWDEFETELRKKCEGLINQ